MRDLGPILLSLTFATTILANPCSNIVGPEWGPLKTVVIGNPLGAHFPSEISSMMQATLPGGATLREILENPGKPFPAQIVEGAEENLQVLIALLQNKGIRVLRPEFSPDFFARPIQTNFFKTPSGLYAAMPRDNLLLLPPNIVVAAPMAWRSRYRENEAYANVLASLERDGFRVVHAPRPNLSNASYQGAWQDYSTGPLNPVVTNQEALFDAADFLRFGNHIVGQLSHVTNKKGIAFIRSVLPEPYRLHIIDFNDAHPMHVDATLMPLNLGKALVHPERVPPELRTFLLNTLFKGWNFVETPQPRDIGLRPVPLYFTSPWINMNILVGDRWAMIEENDDSMRRLLEAQGIEAIMCPFQHFQSLGGSFHCSSLDIRASGATPAESLNATDDLHIYFDRGAKKFLIRDLETLLREP